MKQTLLILSAILCLSIFSKGQTIPNGDFEKWNSTIWDELNNPWSTSNKECIAALGYPNVTKVAGFSGQAVHLQTYIHGTDTLPGTIANFATNASNGPGMPYTQKPTGITGYYRCSMAGHDTGFLAIGFLSGGHIQYLKYIPFTGSVSIFKQFSDTINLSFTPDSVIVAAVSSNEVGFAGISAGSWLELDQLAFTGATQPIAGGDFEGWTTKSLVTPIGWQLPNLSQNGIDSTGITRSTDHYSGSYALRMSAIPNFYGPQITNGHYDPAGQPVGGLPFNRMTDTLTGYYKYTTTGIDSGILLVRTLQNGASADSGEVLFLKPSSTWKYFEIAVKSNILPDTMQIDMAASSDFSNQFGSVLYIDDLQLKSQPLHTSGIDGPVQPGISSVAFPDPARDVLNIKFGADASSPKNIRIYNMQGQILLERNSATGSSVSIPVDMLNPGVYFYEVTANGITARNKFVKGN